MAKKKEIFSIDQFKCELNRDVTEAEITQRAVSIKQNGLINAISVQSLNEKPYKYVVIAGRVRFLAMVKLGVESLTLNKDFKVFDDANAELISFVENDERKDLSLAEQVSSLAQLSQSMTIKDLAQELGRTPKYIALRINLDNLSNKWKKELADKRYPALKIGHYEVIAKYPKETQDHALEENFNIDLDDPGTIAEFDATMKAEYQRLIKDIPWNINVPLQGTAPAMGCIKCDQRSSCSGEWLFEDMADRANDRCLNKECYDNHFKVYVEQQQKVIEDRNKEGAQIHLISNESWRPDEVLTSGEYEKIDDVKVKPNAFNVDTGEYERIKTDAEIEIDSGGSGAGTGTGNVKQEKTLQERLDELLHKRQKVAVEAVIDIVKNDEIQNYTMPDHETLYKLGAMLSPESICGWHDEDIPYGLDKSWDTLNKMSMEELDVLYFANLKESLVSEMYGDISDTLDRIIVSRTMIVCELLEIDWDSVWVAARLSVKESKVLTKMRVEAEQQKEIERDAEMEELDNDRPMF